MNTAPTEDPERKLQQKTQKIAAECSTAAAKKSEEAPVLPMAGQWTHAASAESRKAAACRAVQTCIGVEAEPCLDHNMVPPPQPEGRPTGDE